MPRDSENRVGSEDPSYKVYKSGSARDSGTSRSGAPSGPRLKSEPARPERVPYTKYRSAPRGLLARLRGADDVELSLSEMARGRDRGSTGGPGRFQRGPRRLGAGLFRGPWGWKRVLVGFVSLIVFWLLLSLMLFAISVEVNGANLPPGAESQLTSGGPMLTSANTVLILGLDTRPKTGVGSKEPGSNYSDKNANTDTIMLWRVGGGVSRRLSIPRDTYVNIPGAGMSKINAAWSYGGPALALKVIKQFTGLQINHLIVINLANFPKFIDDVGGVTIRTDRVCSTISGGVANGGFTLNLRPGVHHLDGEQAMILARTRENSCNPAENDLTREKRQQQILNAIKSQLLSFHTFLNLPWVAWDAPSVLETDMGPLQLMEMFTSAELAGSAPVALLKETPEVTPGGSDVLVPNAANVHAAVQKLLTG